MSNIRNLVPFAASFGPQANDENHFFEESELGEIFTVDKSLPPKTIHLLASKSGWNIEYCAPSSKEYAEYGRLTYKITGRCVEFKTISETKTVNYSCNPLHFGKYVYMQIFAESIESIGVFDGEKQISKKTMTWGTCVSKKYFDERILEHGLDPSWAIKFKFQNDEIVSLTPRQLKMYSEGKPLPIEKPDDVLSVLRCDDTQLLVHPTKPTTRAPSAYQIMYDVDWNPIYRLFPMTFPIQGMPDIYGYDYKPLISFLKECKEVKVTSFKEGIRFTYIPSKKTFKELAELATHEIPKRIVQILCLEQFKKK